MDFLPKDPAILEIRKAERQDVPLLLEFIKGIARYAKMEDEVIASPDVLEREMFDEHRAEAVFAVVDGREVGFALRGRLRALLRQLLNIHRTFRIVS